MDEEAPVPPSAAIHPRRHFRGEMARLAAWLGHLVRQSRAMGRSPAGETLQGLVIEDGEAEGVTIELCRRWSDDTGAPAMAFDSKLFGSVANADAGRAKFWRPRVQAAILKRPATKALCACMSRPLML